MDDIFHIMKDKVCDIELKKKALNCIF